MSTPCPPATPRESARQAGRKAPSKKEVRRAVWLVDRCSALPIIEAAMTAPTGRPRTYSWRTLLIGFSLAAIHSEGNDLRIATATRALISLNARQRRAVGLTGPVRYDLIQTMLTDLAAATQSRINTATGEVIEPRLPLTAQDIANSLVEASLISGIPRSTHFAIDSTDHETSARRRSRTTVTPEGHVNPDDITVVEAVDGTSRTVYVDPRSGRHYPYLGADGRYLHTPDPDATDGYRSGKNLRHRDIFAGWDLHILTDAGIAGAPGLATAIEVAPAGSHKGDAGVRLITRAIARGTKITDIYADRGYSNTLAPRWAHPLRERRIGHHHDFHSSESRQHPTDHPGVTIIDGHPFVTTMPHRLRDLTRPAFQETRKKALERAATYDERIPYAFTYHSTTSGGSIRYRGPALTRKARCPNNPQLRTGYDKPQTDCPPTGCSCAAIITLKPTDAFIKHLQPKLFGTTAWLKAYGRRNLVESFNASLKGGHYHLSRTSFAVMGGVKATLMLGFAVAAANLAVTLARYGLDPARPATLPADGETINPLPRERKPADVEALKYPAPPPVEWAPVKK